MLAPQQGLHSGHCLHSSRQLLPRRQHRNCRNRVPRPADLGNRGKHGYQPGQHLQVLALLQDQGLPQGPAAQVHPQKRKPPQEVPRTVEDQALHGVQGGGRGALAIPAHAHRPPLRGKLAAAGELHLPVGEVPAGEAGQPVLERPAGEGGEADHHHCGGQQARLLLLRHALSLHLRGPRQLHPRPQGAAGGQRPLTAGGQEGLLQRGDTHLLLLAQEGLAHHYHLSQQHRVLLREGALHQRGDIPQRQGPPLQTAELPGGAADRPGAPLRDLLLLLHRGLHPLPAQRLQGQLRAARALRLPGDSDAQPRRSRARQLPLRPRAQEPQPVLRAGQHRKDVRLLLLSPSIRAAELLINYYRNQQHEQSRFTQFHEETYCRLFLYADVHGHTSALPSFIYGNHTDRLEHIIENRCFCKMLECNFLPNGFSKAESEFSKKNMAVQERHDEFSKLCSGRVFAGRSDSNEHLVFHSYTLEVLPYWEEFPRRRLDSKAERINAMDYARMLGKAFAATILDTLDINPESRLNEQQLTRLRRNIEKECMNEQSRKLLSFKKLQSNTEHAQNGENCKGRAQTYHKEYFQRWFSNQIYVKELLKRQQLIKEPKLMSFFQKISCLTNLGNVELFQSSRKSRAQRKTHTEPKEILSELNKLPKDKIIFVCRKERGKIQSRVNKQTLEIRNDFEDLLKNKTQQKQVDFLKYKRQSLAKKQASNWTDRYENQIVNKITHDKRKAFQIKVKEIIPKHKNNRVQTETIASESNINECPSVLARNFSKKDREKSTPKRQFNNIYERPSFVEEFMMKIRQQREAANVFLNKYECQDECKQKGSKKRPTIQEQLNQQEKKILPILRRNKIFTIANQDDNSANLDNYNRIYQSIIPGRRKYAETESQIDEAFVHTKQILIAQKKEEIIREQILKKSQKMSEYKN